MKKIITKGIIILIIIIAVTLGILYIYEKITHNADIEKAKEIQSDFELRLNQLKQQKDLIGKKFEKLSSQEKTIVYKKVVVEKKEAIDLSEDLLEENKKILKNWSNCERKLKLKDLILLSGIAGIGFDQDFNLTGQVGGTINGKIHDGFFTRLYLGGGASYTFRTDFEDVVNGVNILLGGILLIGK